LDTQAGDDIAVFVVWSDQVGGAPRHVPDAAALMPDRRAHHYWDGDRVMGRAYRILKTESKTIDVGTEAWDVWLLFDQEATWSADSPPQAVWWEHQLRVPPPERMLDPARFAGKAAELRRKP
jgi:hypothetical protein